jgi:hypothetical protein
MRARSWNSGCCVAVTDRRGQTPLVRRYLSPRARAHNAGRRILAVDRATASPSRPGHLHSKGGNLCSDVTWASDNRSEPYQKAKWSFRVCQGGGRGSGRGGRDSGVGARGSRLEGRDSGVEARGSGRGVRGAGSGRGVPSPECRVPSAESLFPIAWSLANMHVTGVTA